jgi:ectoine hydroxylase-related dioxygenase (phytanoyl-CoA dioxygenase family)
MNFKNLSKQFWQDGYLVLDGFFDAALMQQMDRNIRRHFGKNPDFFHQEEFLSKSSTEVIPWFPQNPELPDHSRDMAIPFDALETDERLAQLTRAVLGENWSALYSMVMFSKKGTAGQAWHQDCPPDDSARFNLNRLVYTRDLTDQVGGKTVVMPGSHRLGELPAGEPHEDLPGQLVLSPRRGTLVLLHGHTWHRVLPITGAFRFSTNYRACPQDTPADITDICVYRNMRYCFSTQSIIEERPAQS